MGFGGHTSRIDCLGACSQDKKQDQDTTVWETTLADLAMRRAYNVNVAQHPWQCKTRNQQTPFWPKSITFPDSFNILSVNWEAYLAKEMINPISPEVYVLDKKRKRKKSCHWDPRCPRVKNKGTFPLSVSPARYRLLPSLFQGPEHKTQDPKWHSFLVSTSNNTVVKLATQKIKPCFESNCQHLTLFASASIFLRYTSSIRSFRRPGACNALFLSFK